MSGVEIISRVSDPVVRPSVSEIRSPKRELNSEDSRLLFLKQLQYQSPFDPMDTATMTSQMNQLNTAETLQEIKGELSRMRFASLVGKEIEIEVVLSDSVDSPSGQLLAGSRARISGQVEAVAPNSPKGGYLQINGVRFKCQDIKNYSIIKT